MTTDNFTKAARAEAAERFPFSEGYESGVYQRRGFVAGAAWARDRLAQQEPTDAEVLAALNADYALRFGPRNLPADSLEPYGDETVRIMRAALSAARAARRDEEKRDG